MHSTNGNSENSEIGVISEFSECTVGRPLTHRKLNQRFGWKAPWFILRTAGRCSEAPLSVRKFQQFLKLHGIRKKLACSACSQFCQTPPILEQAMAVAPRVPNQIRNLKCGMFGLSGGDSNFVGRRTASTQKPQPNSKHRNSKASKS